MVIAYVAMLTEIVGPQERLVTCLRRFAEGDTDMNLSAGLLQHYWLIQRLVYRSSRR